MLCERTSKADLFERQRVIRLILEHKPEQEDVRLLAISVLCEGVQFISERSAGRGVSLRPVSLRSKKWGIFILNIEQYYLIPIILFMFLHHTFTAEENCNNTCRKY